MYKYIYTYMYILYIGPFSVYGYMENGNRNRKFVFLSRQTINDVCCFSKRAHLYTGVFHFTLSVQWVHLSNWEPVRMYLYMYGYVLLTPELILNILLVWSFEVMVSQEHR